jgi:excisionase family DNA binding protein
MGALKKIELNDLDRERLQEFLNDHLDEMPERVINFLADVAAKQGPTFFFDSTTEFSSQNAADILGVSRPYLIGLLDKKEIRFRWVGKHRRVDAISLMVYKEKLDERHRKIADKLTSIAEEYDL